MNAGPLLRIENLCGGYGDVGVVKGFSLGLALGEVACVTGRNGVGKTTLARLVAGSLIPTSGRVTV